MENFDTIITNLTEAIGTDIIMMFFGLFICAIIVLILIFNFKRIR